MFIVNFFTILFSQLLKKFQNIVTSGVKKIIEFYIKEVHDSFTHNNMIFKLFNKVKVFQRGLISDI